MAEKFCLNCWYSYDTRKPNTRFAQCSHCRTKHIYAVSDLVAVVNEVHQLLQDPAIQAFGSFQSVISAGPSKMADIPKKFKAACPKFHKMVARLPYPECIVAIGYVIGMASEHDPAKMPIEDYVQLQLMKMKKTQKQG